MWRFARRGCRGVKSLCAGQTPCPAMVKVGRDEEEGSTMMRLGLAALAATVLAAGGAAAQPVVFSWDDGGRACISRERSPDGGHDVLALGPCDRPAARFIFDERAMRIRAADSPDLCLSDATGAGAAPFAVLLRPCADQGIGQFYAYDRGSRRLLSLNEGNRFDRDSFCQYLGPQRGERTAILARPCSDRAAQTAHVTFYMLPAAR